MSDIMFNELPKDSKYTNWKELAKEYTVHDDSQIKGFFEEYKWLSNFQKCQVYFEGLLYPSSENAYQAAKVEMDYRHHFQNCTAEKSKNLWKKHPLIDNYEEEWDARKYDVMSVIVFDKFYRNKELRQKLIDTGDKYLEEANHWKDIYWGVDINLSGQNNLGKLLMKIREFWK